MKKEKKNWVNVNDITAPMIPILVDNTMFNRIFTIKEDPLTRGIKYVCLLYDRKFTK